MRTVFQLIYASAATVPFDEAALEELLRHARQANDKVGVRGILLYDKGSFLQVLEGEEAVVRRLYEKICADPRHGKATLLWAGQVDEPEFGEWSMGFVSERRFRLASLPGYDDYLSQRGRADGTTAVGQAAQRVLAAFRDGRYRKLVG